MSRQNGILHIGLTRYSSKPPCNQGQVNGSLIISTVIYVQGDIVNETYDHNCKATIVQTLHLCCVELTAEQI